MLSALGFLLLCLCYLSPFMLPPLVLGWGRRLEVSIWLFVAASVVLRITTWYDACQIDAKDYPDNTSLGSWYWILLIGWFGLGLGLALRVVIMFFLSYLGYHDKDEYGNLENFKKWLVGRKPAKLSFASKVLLMWPIAAGAISLLTTQGRYNNGPYFFGLFHSLTEMAPLILMGIALGIAFCSAPIRWALFSALPAVLFQLYFFWTDMDPFGPMWSTICVHLGATLTLILIPAYVAGRLRYRQPLTKSIPIQR
ncbi:hypothetical protein LMG18101_05068 [Ralstonia flaminis]|uniref:Transmembrane protein n=1 Tax=Ralstonia flaminis TaxID=3058597 RepID=A0ABN9JS29_9RALS|nr:hypothetical protein LMG18101_05068 [Ralstonia sp. LMG 18101]